MSHSHGVEKTASPSAPSIPQSIASIPAWFVDNISKKNLILKIIINPLVSSCFQMDRMTFESILEVREVQTEDYGLYHCMAQNEIDSDSHDVQLDVTSVPDTPLRFRVINSTDNSIMLTWDPGFNGGFEQTYNIMYFETEGPELRKYVDVHPRGATTFDVGALRRGTPYGFRIKALNTLGSSNYTTENVQYDTTSEF